MADNLFEGLPPPSVNPLAPPPEQHQQESHQNPKTPTHVNGESSSFPAPNPVLKSALKRPKPIEPNPPPEGIVLLPLFFRVPGYYVQFVQFSLLPISFQFRLSDYCKNCSESKLMILSS